MVMLRLIDPVSAIPDLNVAQHRAIKAFGARSIGDLIEILPRRYDDYSNTVAIRRAPLQEPVTLKVTVEKIALGSYAFGLLHNACRFETSWLEIPKFRSVKITRE